MPAVFLQIRLRLDVGETLALLGNELRNALRHDLNGPLRDVLLRNLAVTKRIRAHCEANTGFGQRQDAPAMFGVHIKAVEGANCGSVDHHFDLRGLTEVLRVILEVAQKLFPARVFVNMEHNVSDAASFVS